MNTNMKRAEWLKYLCLGISYAFSYTYISMFSHNDLGDISMTIIVSILGLLAIVWLELCRRQQSLRGTGHKRASTLETRFWEGSLLLLCLNTYFGFWPSLSFFLIHPLVIYMVLCGTGHLLADRSSVFLPIDLMNGTICIAIENCFARISTIFHLDKEKGKTPVSDGYVPTSVSGATVPVYPMPVYPTPGYPMPVTAEEKKTGLSGVSRIVAIIGVVFAALIIFLIAFSNLASVDGNFASASKWIDSFFSNVKVADVILRIVFSIPVGMFLFGLFQGSVLSDGLHDQERHRNFIEKSSNYRFLPNAIVTGILGIFILVYLAFYISQASYMFSGFAGVLPEAYTASEYAVSGFMELIRVVLINFVLMALIRAFSSRESKLVTGGSIALMVESCIFATISASKIILYMSRFGFTESRTLGLWGTIVVFAGAIATIVHILTERKTFAPWLWFSVGSYVLMQFLSCVFLFE